MPAGYEVEDPDTGQRAWWDGKKLTPLDAQGFGMKKPPAQANLFNPQAFNRSRDTLAAIDDAKRRSGWTSTGLLGGWLANNVRGSGAYNLDKDLDTLKARTAFDELQYMRQNNPTGGALGGIAVEELKMLQAAESNLDVGQSEDQIDKNLDRMRRSTVLRQQGISPENPVPLSERNRAQIPEGAYFRAGDGRVYKHTPGAGYRPGGAPAKPDQGGRGGLPPGVTPEEWSVMTPEERRALSR